MVTLFKIFLLCFGLVLFSGCSFLYHKNSWNGLILSYEKPPAGCEGTIPIIVHWGAGWHTSIVIPNHNNKVNHYFTHFPFLEVNWGDKGFYQAGASQWAQQIAAPKAMLLPSTSVMYFIGIPENQAQWCSKYDKPVVLSASDRKLLALRSADKRPNTLSICSKIEGDYKTLFRYFDAHQVWVTSEDFSAITKAIHATLALDVKGDPVELGNGYLFDPSYSTAGRFFASDAHYFGLFHTCNTWTAEVLGNIAAIETINKSKIYRADGIFSYLQEQIETGNTCVRRFLEK